MLFKLFERPLFYMCALVLMLLCYWGTTAQTQAPTWRGTCNTDVGQLAQTMQNADQIVVVERPHAQSDSAMMATRRMCVLYKIGK